MESLNEYQSYEWITAYYTLYRLQGDTFKLELPIWKHRPTQIVIKVIWCQNDNSQNFFIWHLNETNRQVVGHAAIPSISPIYCDSFWFIWHPFAIRRSLYDFQELFPSKNRSWHPKLTNISSPCAFLTMNGQMMNKNFKFL